MLSEMVRLVKLGRNFGIGVTLISQRPQAVSKEVLNLTECLIVFQTAGHHEREVLRKWIIEKDRDSQKLVDELPDLAKGTTADSTSTIGCGGALNQVEGPSRR